MAEEQQMGNLYGLTPLKSADETIMANFALQSLLFLIMLPLFLFLRKKLSWLYTPNISKRTKHPLYNQRGWIDWIKPLFFVEDPQLLYLIGLDNFIFLVTLRMIIKIFLILTVTIGLPLCLLYFFNTEGANKSIFESISILAAKGNSKLLLLGIILMYGATFISSYCVFIQTKKLIHLRQLYIQNPSLLTSIYQLKKIEWRLQSHSKMLDYINTPKKTVMIRNLPKSIKNKKDYKDYLETLNMGTIENLCLLKDSKKLENLIELQRRTVKRIEYEFQVGYNDLRKFVKNRIKEIRKGNENFSKSLIKEEDKEYVNTNGSLNTNLETSDLFVYNLEERKRLFFKFINNEKLKVYGTLNLFIAELRDIMEGIEDEVSRGETLPSGPETPPTEAETNNTEDETPTTEESPSQDSTTRREIIEPEFLTYKDLLIIPTDEIQNKSSKTGFVTYKNQNSATVVSQCIISDKPYECYSEIAPPPTDILWSNINLNRNVTNILRFISSFVFILYSLFFIFLVASIISSIDLDILIEVLDRFKIPSEWQNFIKVTIDGILAPLLLNLFISLSAYVIKLFIKIEVRPSYSDEQRQLMKKHMNFLIYELILGTYLGSTLVSILFNFIETQNFDFEKIIKEFSEKSMTVSLLFTNIVIQRSLLGLINILMKYGSLFKILCVPFTSRDKLEYRRAPAIDFGLLYPAIIIVMPMCLINLILTPILILLGLIYFLLVYFIQKHEFLYSLINELESGGTHWEFFSNFIFNVLLLMQFITFCFFLNSNAKSLSILFIPLFVITYKFSSSLINEIKSGFANLPLKNHTPQIPYEWEWSYDLEIERDAIEMNLIYKSQAEYIYEDLSVGRIYNRILLPEGFFRAIKYIEEEDSSGILGFS